MKQIFLILSVIGLFLSFHYAEVYMHEQTHFQTALNYGCNPVIESQQIFFARTLPNCPQLSELDTSNLKLAYSIQESYYSDFIFHRFIVFFILLGSYLYLSRKI